MKIVIHLEVNFIVLLFQCSSKSNFILFLCSSKSVVIYISTDTTEKKLALQDLLIIYF